MFNWTISYIKQYLEPFYIDMLNWIVRYRTVWSFNCAYSQMCLQIIFNRCVKTGFGINHGWYAIKPNQT